MSLTNALNTGSSGLACDAGELYLSSTAVTATAANLNATASVTAGTVAASKAVVVDSNKDIGDFRNLDAVNFDAGASGTAGSYDVFPSTAAKGKTTIVAAANAGDTTTTITNAEQAGARTYTIPDAGASASFAMTEGTQTINGTKTIPVIVTTNIDVGASGVVGSLDVFPTTASKGKLTVTCTDQTGNTAVGLVAGAMGQATTVTIPDPLAAAANVMLGIQTSTARTATADGLTTGTIADAGMHQFITVTSAGANDIIVLPTPTPGKTVILAVGANGYELRSNSPTTVAINGGTGADAESAIAANSMVLVICTSATSWAGIHITAATLTAIEAAA